MKEYVKIFDRLKEFDMEQYRSYISASQYLASYGLVKKYCRGGWNILDWGAGKGHFSYFLLEQGYKVTGFNVQEEEQRLLKYLRAGYPEKYSLVYDPGASSALPFGDGSFDAVCSIGVLEHVRETGGDEVKSLREIRRVLKPGGVFICTHFPNKYSWIEAATRRMKNKHHHQHTYSKKDIKEIIKQSGLEMLEGGRYGFFPRLTFGRFRTPPLITNLFNAADTGLSFVFNVFTQNHYFVAGKK